MTRELRIVFMGTPDFAVGVLKTLIEGGKNVVGVITAPDRPAGRGRKLRPSAVKQYAVEQKLSILQPTNLKDTTFLEKLKSWEANLQVVVAFRMLPKVVWQLPEYGTFNLHASLLPEYRGAAPINWAIINGEHKTGVTTFFIDEKIDTGEIIANKEIAIADNETAGTLHDKLMSLGSELVLETVATIEVGGVVTQPQPKSVEFKEAPKLHAENTRIDWNKEGKSIENLIRGLSPYPVAWTQLHNDDEEMKMKIYDASFIEEAHMNENGNVNTTKKEIKVAVANGYLYIKELQLPGKRKMDVNSLLNGFTFTKDAKVM